MALGGQGERRYAHALDAGVWICSGLGRIVSGLPLDAWGTGRSRSEDTDRVAIGSAVAGALLQAADDRRCPPDWKCDPVGH